eukprot:5043926-Amphidinium_carterae.1
MLQSENSGCGCQTRSHVGHVAARTVSSISLARPKCQAPQCMNNPHMVWIARMREEMPECVVFEAFVMSTSAALQVILHAKAERDQNGSPLPEPKWLRNNATCATFSCKVETNRESQRSHGGTPIPGWNQ